MKTTKKLSVVVGKAKALGKKDGTEWAREEGVSASAAELREAVAPGQVEADEGLVNALLPRDLARALGVKLSDVEGRTDKYRAALRDYNAGFVAGVLKVAAKLDLA